MLALYLGGCTGAGASGRTASISDEDSRAATIDYAARHRLMLETVIERPVRVQAWLEERERRNRAIYKESWEKVMARQEAFGEVQKRKRRGDRDQFLLMIERQRLLNQPRDDDRSERWARFVEQGASADGQMGGVDAAPLQP